MHFYLFSDSICSLFKMLPGRLGNKDLTLNDDKRMNQNFLRQ